LRAKKQIRPCHGEWHWLDSFSVKTARTVLGATIFIVYYYSTQEHSKK
jgi:hypothetical protein